MHEKNHRRNVTGPHDAEHVHHDDNSYWRRAHRDWRFWVGLFLMCAAIATYFLSDDLSLVPSSQPQHLQSGEPEK
jgi:hypothetical protein